MAFSASREQFPEPPCKFHWDKTERRQEDFLLTVHGNFELGALPPYLDILASAKMLKHNSSTIVVGAWPPITGVFRALRARSTPTKPEQGLPEPPALGPTQKRSWKGLAKSAKSRQKGFVGDLFPDSPDFFETVLSSHVLQSRDP